MAIRSSFLLMSSLICAAGILGTGSILLALGTLLGESSSALRLLPPFLFSVATRLHRSSRISESKRSLFHSSYQLQDADISPILSDGHLEKAEASLSESGSGSWNAGNGSLEDQIQENSHLQKFSNNASMLPDSLLPTINWSTEIAKAPAAFPSSTRDLHKGNETSISSSGVVPRGFASSISSDSLSDQSGSGKTSFHQSQLFSPSFDPSEESRGDAARSSDSGSNIQTSIRVAEMVKAEPLRVYVYNLPANFTWDILRGISETTVLVQGPGVFLDDVYGTIDEQSWGWVGGQRNASVLLPGPPSDPHVGLHAVAYYLLISLFTGLNSVRRVAHPEDAELLLLPAFTSIAYLRLRGNPHRRDRDEELQEDLFKWLQQQDLWRRWAGQRHVVVAHHPHSSEHILPHLHGANLVVADFWRPSSRVDASTRLSRDVVAPYRVFVEPYSNDTLGWRGRPTLLFFRGGTKRKRRGRIREELQKMFENEKDVICEESNSRQEGAVQATAEGMRQSKFCLSPAGDTPSSCRLFDAIVSHCVPVIVSDRLELPFEEVLDYSQFSLFIGEDQALEAGVLLGWLRSISQQQWEALWERLKQVKRHFIFRVPAEEGGAEDMVWQALSRRAREGGFNGTFRKERRMVQKGKKTQRLPSFNQVL